MIHRPAPPATGQPTNSGAQLPGQIESSPVARTLAPPAAAQAAREASQGALKVGVQPQLAPTRGEQLLEQRRRWLEEWSTWPDDQILKRLRKLGVDAEGFCRDDLIEVLLRAETENLDRKRCTPQRLQIFALGLTGFLIMGTFVTVAGIFILGG